jgi:phospholipid/cholesterol/gamma-HCH transport system ATP-binding protein
VQCLWPARRSRTSRSRRPAGEIIGVVGGSGTGKSVLMRAIIGLQIPTEGSIEVLGQSITDARDDHEISIRNRWGVLFQGARCSRR